MGCCLVVLLAFLGPRFVMAMLYLFTERLTIAFQSGWAGIAGFIFLPWTAVTYALAYHPLFGVQGIGWLFVALGVLADLGSYAGGGRRGQTWRSD
jgi:hypothetical protein